MHGTRIVRFADGGARPDSGHVALLLFLAQEGRFLGVANTHLKWDAPGTSPALRWSPRQVEQLLEVYRRLDVPYQAWIICGDLNALPDSDVLSIFKQASLVDAYADWPTAFTCNANSQVKRIDYLLHTGGLESRPHALPAIDVQTPLPSFREPSDHLPIMASFDWKPG